MLAVLPVLSFICAGLLAVFLTILLRRPTINTANVSIVVWLLLGNTIHGVNALIWSSNVQNRVPIWCDIVTKLLLGVNVALPGVCLCSARYLELLSSSRKLYPNTYSKRLHTLLDIALCYVLPLLYMALHFAVQDHRFDLLQDFGCSASIHRSTPAVLIMLFPPLILCSISLVLCITSIYHYTRFPSPTHLTTHLSARSALSAPRFLRRLVKSTLLTAFVLASSLFPLVPPRTSLHHAHHADRSAIFVLRDPRAVVGAEVVWCAIPSVALVYLLLSAALGDGNSDVLRSCLRRRAMGPTTRPELRLLTTFPPPNAKSTLALSLCTPSPGPSPLSTPHTVELRSGWDDMLDLKKNPVRPGALSSPYHRKSIVSGASSSEDSNCDGSSTAGPATPPLKDDAEEAFASATLGYLASPMAQALGLPSPLAAPSPSPSPSPTMAKARTPSPPAPALVHCAPQSRSRSRSTSPPALKAHFAPPQQPIPEDTASTISSIWDAPWPLPPAPARVPPSRRTASSRGHDAYAYTMYAPVEPRPTSPPFEDSSLSVPPSPSLAPHRTQVPRKSAMKKTQSGLQRMRSSGSSRELGNGKGFPAVDVVYMTRTVEERA